MISITGVTGVFFRALALTVGMALLTSLALALTWTPTLSHYLLRRDGIRPKLRRATHAERSSGWLMRRLRTRAAVRARPSAGAGAFAVATDRRFLLLLQALGTDLLPEMDEGGFILDYIMPAGSSLAETEPRELSVEKILRATPEVESTSRRTGLQLGLAAGDRGEYRRLLRR